MSKNINMGDDLTSSGSFEKLNKSQLEKVVNLTNQKNKFKLGTDYASSPPSFKRDNTKNPATENFGAQSTESYSKESGKHDDLSDNYESVSNEFGLNAGHGGSNFAGDNVVDKVEHTVADHPPSSEVGQLQSRIAELEEQIAARQHTEQDLDNVLNLLNLLSDDLRPITKTTSDTIQHKLWELLDELIIERVGKVIDLDSEGFQTKLLNRVRELHTLETTLLIKLNADDLEIIGQNRKKNLNFDSYVFESDPSLRRSEFIIENNSFVVEDKVIKPHREDENKDV